jgi:hypothetical protein
VAAVLLISFVLITSDSHSLFPRFEATAFKVGKRTFSKRHLLCPKPCSAHNNTARHTFRSLNQLLFYHQKLFFIIQAATHSGNESHHRPTLSDTHLLPSPYFTETMARRRRPPRAGALAEMQPLRTAAQIAIIQSLYYVVALVLVLFTTLVAGMPFSLNLILGWDTVRGDTTQGWLMSFVWIFDGGFCM